MSKIDVKIVSNNTGSGSIRRSGDNSTLGTVVVSKASTDKFMSKARNAGVLGIIEGGEIVHSAMVDAAPLGSTPYGDGGLLKNSIGYYIYLDQLANEFSGGRKSGRGLNSYGGEHTVDDPSEYWSRVTSDISGDRLAPKSNNEFRVAFTAYAVRELDSYDGYPQSRYDGDKGYNKVNYAPFVEFGTRNSRANHFMRRAISNTRSEMKNALIDSLKKAIK